MRYTVIYKYDIVGNKMYMYCTIENIENIENVENIENFENINI